jgi:hypothetical protein
MGQQGLALLKESKMVWALTVVVPLGNALLHLGKLLGHSSAMQKDNATGQLEHLID